MPAALLALALIAAQPVPKTLVPYPHPLITELLYAVPSGVAGDANPDGHRSATGDEFVELVNPHTRPINLKGYTLSDGTPDLDADPQPALPKSKPVAPPDAAPPVPRLQPTHIHFTFPDLTLKPGQIVLVFNGYEQTFPAPTGDAQAAPSATNPAFHGAYLFSMNIDSQFIAFANRGDCLLLSDPSGVPVHCISWGKSDKNKPTPAPFTEEAPESRGSVQRAGLFRGLHPHPDLNGDLAGLPFSPGQFDPKAAPPPAGPPAKGKPVSPTKPGPK